MITYLRVLVHLQLKWSNSAVLIILDRANSKTLVVADELANQSEVASGTAIVAASIKKLYDRNVKFVTATHFHQLAKLELLQSLPEVHIIILKYSIMILQEYFEYDRNIK